VDGFPASGHRAPAGSCSIGIPPDSWPRALMRKCWARSASASALQNRMIPRCAASGVGGNLQRDDVTGQLRWQDGEPSVCFVVGRQRTVVGENNLRRVATFQRHGWPGFERRYATGDVGVAETVAFPDHLGPCRRALKTIAQSVADIFGLFIARPRPSAARRWSRRCWRW